MRSVLARTLLFSTVVSIASAAQLGFTLTTLASDATDPQLINPWGIAASGTSPLWIGSNGTGVSEIYSGAGVKAGLVVSLPGDGTVTGLAFNGTTSFNSDLFLFASEDGTFSGWRNSLGTQAEALQLSSTSNVYKGLTLDTVGTATYALLANFRTGSIDVVKGNGANPDLTGKFTDPNLPSGYAPFNVQALNGSIYVTYAKQDSAAHDETPGAGLGFVDQFDGSGNFLGRVVSNGFLNAPWGLAIAPAGFDSLGGDLLVGNFGDGRINAYTTAGTYVETLMGINGTPLTIDGLWALHFGSGTANGGNALSLFVTAGPNDESGGLLARIDAVPEPQTWLLAALGMAAVVVMRRRTAAPRM